MSAEDRVAAAQARAAGAAGIAALHLALKQRVQAVVAAFALETKDATVQRAPLVFDGWVPPKNEDQFPFVCVRPVSGQDSEQSADQDARAVFDLVIGTYSDTDDGWLDVVLLIDALRADLDAGPAIQGTGFEQTGALTWEVPREQPRPQWFGRVTTNWTIPRPRRVENRNPEES